jgi:hypothetical protein
MCNGCGRTYTNALTAEVIRHNDAVKSLETCPIGKGLVPFCTRSVYLQNFTPRSRRQSALVWGETSGEREAFNLHHCCVHTSLTADSESSPLSSAPRTSCKSAIEILAFVLRREEFQRKCMQLARLVCSSVA